MTFLAFTWEIFNASIIKAKSTHCIHHVYFSTYYSTGSTCSAEFHCIPTDQELHHRCYSFCVFSMQGLITNFVHQTYHHILLTTFGMTFSEHMNIPLSWPAQVRNSNPNARIIVTSRWVKMLWKLWNSQSAILCFWTLCIAVMKYI